MWRQKGPRDKRITDMGWKSRRLRSTRISKERFRDFGTLKKLI